MDDIDGLRDRWNYLYRDYLPALAKAKDPAQCKWPVYLDHCFARIVLDNAIGKDRPWTEVLKSPAVRTMTASQFQAAISLAEQIVNGEADLAELDNRSLQFRGKKQKANGTTNKVSSKKRKSEATISSYFTESPPSKKVKQETDQANDDDKHQETALNAVAEDTQDMSTQLHRIASSKITPFRKQTLSLLCHIPRGRYSTYQALSDHITANSHKTCARAVGNAMRNNPFAPEVPCHRVLANDGSLGGFNGYWGEEGKFASEKHRLLFEEGVRFDSKGKVKGPVFREFGG